MLTETISLKDKFEFPPPGFLDFMKAISALDREFDEIMSDADDAIARGETQISRANTNILKSVELAEFAALQPAPISGMIAWDKHIAEAENAKQQCLDTYADCDKSLKRIEKLLKKHSPGKARKLSGRFKRIREILLSVVATMEDARWRLITCRAETSGADEGPTFSDHKSLAEYLKQETG